MTRQGRRIKYRVGVVSLTASLYNSHLPQFANPTVVNPQSLFHQTTGEGGALARVRLANSSPAEGRKVGVKGGRAGGGGGGGGWETRKRTQKRVCGKED